MSLEENQSVYRFLEAGFDFSRLYETVFQALASASVRKLKTVALTALIQLSMESHLSLQRQRELAEEKDTERQRSLQALHSAGCMCPEFLFP